MCHHESVVLCQLYRNSGGAKSPDKKKGRRPILSSSGVDLLQQHIRMDTATAEPVMSSTQFPGLIVQIANDERAADDRPPVTKKPCNKTNQNYIKKIGARLIRVDPTDERRARAMHTVWTFAYMASYLGAHLVDVNGVAARARNMVNLDETTLVLTNQSDTVEGQKRFLHVKCLFTSFANGASTAPVMWLRCLPEGTVWQPFMADENGEYRRDANRKLLPGRYRHCIVLLYS